MDLFIIRHAWAEERGDRWPDDSSRPLTDEGRRRMAQVVRTLADRGLAPQVIATSPMVRCRETAEIVASRVPGRPRIVPCKDLLPGGDPKLLLAWTEELSGEKQRIAWVGHAPDVGLLTAAMIGQDDASIGFGKGAIAAIRFTDALELGQGELRWFVTAKILGW